MEKFQVKLTRVRRLSPSTRDFRFVKTDGSPVEFEPGQFYRFSFEDERSEFERSYSLCNFLDDCDDSMLDLVVSTVDGGRASQILFADCEGLVATVSGPYGRLVLPKVRPSRLFLVATSVGIAPYMPMLKVLAQWLFDDDSFEVHFLYGARDQSEFVYGDSLLEFSQMHPGFNVHLCLSRDQSANEIGVSHYAGYVQGRLKQLAPDPANDYVMLCGNPNMIDAAYLDLKELGFGVRQVVREKYVFAKDAKPEKVSTESGNTSPSEEQKRLIAEKMKLYKKS